MNQELEEEFYYDFEVSKNDNKFIRLKNDELKEYKLTIDKVETYEIFNIITKELMSDNRKNMNEVIKTIIQKQQLYQRMKIKFT